ncbi:DinB family protein, partial [Thermosynechococcus sp. OHK43]|uniref:DinB family protein n=1 Tax=Thermosynechococcus sp. OHK43 TaxID=2763133 RepID=UPI0025E5CA17
MNQKFTPSETSTRWNPFDREVFWQAFQNQRQFTLQLVAQLSEVILCAQPHPLYSPVGWHLGHIGYTEAFWLLPEDSGFRDRDRYWYAADGRPKVERQHLPPRRQLLEYLAEIRQRTGDRFHCLSDTQWQQEARLWWWILQHEAQHSET